MEDVLAHGWGGMMSMLAVLAALAFGWALQGIVDDTESGVVRLIKVSDFHS